jgi:hypothetical protein
MMKSGEPITGIDKRPLNKAGMDIGETILWWRANRKLEAIPTRQSFHCQVLRFDAVADAVTAIPTCGIRYANAGGITRSNPD